MLARTIRLDCIKIGQELDDKEAVLQAIADTAASALSTEGLDSRSILDGLHEREKLCSTGFGNGLAIPHCRLDNLEHFVVGALTLSRGVDFDSLDDRPVRLVFFLLGPEKSKREHIHLLSELAHVCKQQGRMEELLAASSPEEFRDLVLESVKGTESLPVQRKADLVQIFVQDDEDLFTELLETASAFDTHMLTVVDTRDAEALLARVPLFRGLMGGTGVPRFGRIITIGLDHGLSNELVRRVQETTGPLQRQGKVFVAVQSLIYAGGRWED